MNASLEIISVVPNHTLGPFLVERLTKIGIIRPVILLNSLDGAWPFIHFAIDRIDIVIVVAIGNNDDCLKFASQVKADRPDVAVIIVVPTSCKPESDAVDYWLNWPFDSKELELAIQLARSSLAA